MKKMQKGENDMDANILVVDDDEDIRNMIGIYLANEGFHFIKCNDGLQAIEMLEEHKVDLILLDIMMPELDGIQTCIQIREKSNAPIIFMSAKSEDMDKIQGLTVGGDDYIVKPFNPLELISRVKAQLRRYRQYNDTSEQECCQYKDLIMNRISRQVWLNGASIHLTPKEYEILEYLLVNKGVSLTLKQIYEKVWKEDYFQNDKTLLVHISNLRDKLAEHSNDTEYIKTIWGVGYRI